LYFFIKVYNFTVAHALINILKVVRMKNEKTPAPVAPVLPIVDDHDKAVAAADADFLPIRAEGFASGSKSRFDVFVRLDSGKYIKLLVAGDQFTPDRLDNYLKKGVTHFYIKKEMQDAYIAYCKTLSTAVLKSTKISAEIKFNQTLNHGDELMHMIRAQGVTTENIEYAKQFIGDIRNLTAQMKPGSDDPVAHFLNDVSAYEHGVGTAMLAGILSYVVEIRTDQPVQVVGIAGLFHDVGLTGLPKECRSEDEEKMTPEQQELYRTHPLRGVDILTKSGTVCPAALQAIEQHHMRHMGFGFPERSNHSAALGRVAEIIGISEEFSRLLLKAKDDPALQILPEMERNVFPGFSRQIVYAFRSAFFPKH
jgi:HD-GYP domain-containing protein (c-di-GMP phosphodiesterase class II)